MRRGAACGAVITMAAVLLPLEAALADGPIRLTNRQLDSVTAAGISAFANSGALALAAGDSAVAFTSSNSSAVSTLSNGDADGQAQAIAVGDNGSSSLAFTDLAIADGPNAQIVEVGAEGIGGEGVVAYAETTGTLSVSQDVAVGAAVARSLGDESTVAATTILAMSNPDIDMQAAGLADGLTTQGAASFAQTVGQLNAEDLAAEAATLATADGVAHSTAAALISLSDSDSSLSVFGVAEAAAGGDAVTLTETSGQLYDSRSVDRGRVSSAAIAAGTDFQQSAADTGGNGTGEIVIAVTNSMGRVIDATTTSPSIAMTQSRTTIVAVNAP